MSLKAIDEFEPAGDFKVLKSDYVYVDGDKKKSLQQKLSELAAGTSVEEATGDDITGIFGTTKSK